MKAMKIASRPAAEIAGSAASEDAGAEGRAAPLQLPGPEPETERGDLAARPGGGAGSRGQLGPAANAGPDEAPWWRDREYCDLVFLMERAAEKAGVTTRTLMKRAMRECLAAAPAPVESVKQVEAGAAAAVEDVRAQERGPAPIRKPARVGMWMRVVEFLASRPEGATREEMNRALGTQGSRLSPEIVIAKSRGMIADSGRRVRSPGLKPKTVYIATVKSAAGAAA